MAAYLIKRLIPTFNYMWKSDNDTNGFKHETYRDKKDAGFLFFVSGAVSVISAAYTSFSLLKTIADNIDTSRVCVIGLRNLGTRKLVNPTWYLSNGVIREPLPRCLPANEAGIFTFEKTSYATAGTSGVMTYTISGTDQQVAVFWSVPFKFGIKSNEFLVKVLTNAHANESLFESLKKDKKKLSVWNDGQWMSASGDGITLYAAMSNSAKAALQVDLVHVSHLKQRIFADTK